MLTNPQIYWVYSTVHPNSSSL